MLQPTTELLITVEDLCKKDSRYKPEAYLFVLAAVHFTVSSLSERRHITGQELLEGIRRYGLEQFGPLTRQVFAHWGITCAKDFGHLVFALVDVGLLGKTDQDSLADFEEGYDFSNAFDPESLFKLSP